MRDAAQIIKKIITVALTAIAVLIMVFTVISVNTFNRDDRNLFGYSFFVVQTDSMSKTDFSAGDVIITRQVDPSTLKEGDIITFRSQNEESFGETLTHKIRRLTTDTEGKAGFITYGTTTDTNDSTIVTYPFVIGKYTAKLPNVGAFFLFLKTTPGYFVCIFIPFILLIVFEGINCVRLFKRYKDEQNAEIKAERDELEKQRIEQLEMLKELQALKAQLDQRADNTTASEEEAAPAYSSQNGVQD